VDVLPLWIRTGIEFTSTCAKPCNFSRGPNTQIGNRLRRSKSLSIVLNPIHVLLRLEVQTDHVTCLHERRHHDVDAIFKPGGLEALSTDAQPQSIPVFFTSKRGRVSCVAKTLLLSDNVFEAARILAGHFQQLRVRQQMHF
jgi:hypothetical protein